MSIQAVFSDQGGVITRTEFQAPRQHLAERLGMEIEDVTRIIFDSETAQRATLGEITEEEHWAAVMRRLRLPLTDAEIVRDEFFAGDVIDRELLDHLRELRKTYKVGLISNAWSGLRPWIVKQKFDDAFDEMVISAEVGVAKPDPRIFELAMEKFGVTPEEAVFIDDTDWALQGAKDVGMHAIHFLSHDQAMNELETILAADG